MSDIDFTKTKIGAILNTASGSCDESSEQKMLDLLQAAGITDPKIWCGAGSDVEEAFAEAKTHELDVLIVLGGDGTIRTAAEACTKDGPFLIALPGGTMNMLPKALYGERNWEQALADTLQKPRVRKISGGRVGTKQFFIAAILGAPALWSEAREAVREGNIGEAVDKAVVALENMFSTKIRYAFSEEVTGEAEAVSIICPLISEALDDTERSLEAAIIDVENAGDVLALASTAAFGKWRDDGHVSIVKTKDVRVTSDTDVPVILDGETIDVGSEVRIEFIPHAFTALVPG